MLEFALVAPFLVTTLAGTFTVGMSMNRALQARQVVRNANVLMVRGYDLSIAANQTLIVRTAQGLQMNEAGTNNPNTVDGKAAVILSRILRVGPVTCNQGISNWNQQPATCPNYGQYVIETRIIIGNQTKWTSFTGGSSSGRDSRGWITKNQAATGSFVANAGFANALTLNLDEFTYLGEIFVDSSDINMLPVLGTNQSIYARNFS